MFDGLPVARAYRDAGAEVNAIGPCDSPRAPPVSRLEADGLLRASTAAPIRRTATASQPRPRGPAPTPASARPTPRHWRCRTSFGRRGRRLAHVAPSLPLAAPHPQNRFLLDRHRSDWLCGGHPSNHQRTPYCVDAPLYYSCGSVLKPRVSKRWSTVITKMVLDLIACIDLPGDGTARPGPRMF